MDNFGKLLENSKKLPVNIRKFAIIMRYSMENFHGLAQNILKIQKTSGKLPQNI